LQTNHDRESRTSLEESAAYDTERYDLEVMGLPASLSAAHQHFAPSPPAPDRWGGEGAKNASQTGGTHENPGVAMTFSLSKQIAPP